MNSLTRRRIKNFRANRRGFWSLWIFTAIFTVSLFSEFIANDKPIVIKYDKSYYFPILTAYPETEFGGELETEAGYNNYYMQEKISEKGRMVWPLIRYNHQTVDTELEKSAPTPPSYGHFLGTDDHGRDVAARLIYGFRISVLFGILLTVLSSAIGIAAGAIQGYFGGWIDLIFQRAIEVWSGMPTLYLLIILSSIVEPNFFWLLGLMFLFSWMGLVGVVRAEFLRGRKLDYVLAARALGASELAIMFKHILPNALVASLTFLPFILSGSITTLTSLDFLGFGLPPGSASLGELLAQGKANLHAPWLGITAFITLGTMLSLLIFVGEAVRDAFDPQK